MLRRSLGLASVLAVASAAPLALAADVATVRVQAGRTYVGSIAGATDSHVFQLDDFVLPGMTITIALKADKSDLEPDLALESPSATDLTSDMAPFRKDGTTSVSVKKFPAPLPDGRYLLRVKSKNGTTGDYKIKITTKVGKSFKGVGDVPGSAESNTLTVPAPADALVTVKVVPVSGSTLQPEFGVPYRSVEIATPLKLLAKPGQASFVNPLTGLQTIPILGAGATEGDFKWTAKLKLPKVSKTPIRVNGAPVFYPDPGPLPAKAVVTSGSSIRGIETDGVELSWREVRTSGGGPNVNKNSLHIAKVTGSSARSLANNFATDVAVTATSFAMGPLDVAVVAEGEFFHAPRLGGGEESFVTGMAGTLRVLASAEKGYFVTSSEIAHYDFVGAGNLTHTLSAGTIQDACIGGKGFVYVVLSGGSVEVYTQTEGGTGDDLVGDLGSQTSATAVVARGRDIFVATDDGGDTAVWRVDALGLLAPSIVFTSTNPLVSLAVDDANIYVMENHATDFGRVVQVPRGGGVRDVLVRDAITGSFTMDLTDVAAAGGYVYVVADVSGTDTILRVKRTK